MRRGFTLVEILAVIALMAVLALIAVPTYITISGTMKENVYNAKIEEIKAKSTTYAQETGKVVFSVDTLISEGRITPDNETGVYKDPRSDRKMNCDIIHISFNDNQYEVSIEESETCYSDEELNNRYGIARLKVVDDQGNEIPSIEGTEWLGVSNVYVTYEIKEEYQDYASNIVGVEWSGEETLSCTSENLTECKRYSVSTTSVKMLTVNFKLTIESNGANIISNYSKNVYLDIVAPEIKEGSILLENEYNTNSERRVRFELTDYNGSGVKEYALVKEKTCTGSEYEANKKNANEGVQTEYLNNGTYYVCVKDKVGNKTPDSELDNNKIEVSNVDSGSPSVSLSINSKDSRYHTKEVTLNINASDNEGTTNLKMCISNTGYLQDCSWESYTNSKNWTLSGDYDGGTRKVYITIQDASGNIGQNESSYTVYKSCTTTTKNYTDSNYGTCSKACGGGVQYRNYQLKDSYLGTVCSTGKDEKACNTQSCDTSPPTFQVTKALSWVFSDTISVVITDNDSGIVGYAWTTTNSQPSTWSTISNRKTHTVTKILNSNQTIYLWAKDANGNIGSVTIVESLIDRNDPTLNYTTPANYVNTAVTVTLSASDNESGVNAIYYKLQGETTYTRYTGPFQTTKGNFYAYAVDNAGNDSYPRYYQTKSDTAPPATPVLDIEETAAESNNRSVSCTANDDQSESQNECTIYANSKRVDYWFYGLDTYPSYTGSSWVAKFVRETWVNGSLRASDTANEGESMPYRTYSASYYYQLIYAIDAAGNKSKNALKINMYFN